MLVFTTEATVTYTCYVEGKDEEKIVEYARQLKEEQLKEYGQVYENDEVFIQEAINELYSGVDGVDLYDHSTETDFSTEEIRFCIEDSDEVDL